MRSHLIYGCCRGLRSQLNSKCLASLALPSSSFIVCLSTPIAHELVMPRERYCDKSSFTSNKCIFKRERLVGATVDSASLNVKFPTNRFDHMLNMTFRKARAPALTFSPVYFERFDMLWSFRVNIFAINLVFKAKIH